MTMADAKKPFYREREAANRRCPICLGKEVLTRDRGNGISVEIDAEFKEMWIWQEDTCLSVFPINYCPNCGARMDDNESEAR